MGKVLIGTFKEFLIRKAVANSEEELIKLLKKFRYPKYIYFRSKNWIVEKNSYIDAIFFELKDANAKVNAKRIEHISVNFNIYSCEIKYGYEVYKEEYNIYDFVPSRQDGPAIHSSYCSSIASPFSFMNVSTYKYWYVDGKLHRTDGPAVLVCNYSGEVTKESWYLKGEKMDEFQIEVAKKLYKEVN